MTAIVGIEHDGRVYLAGDRAVSGDGCDPVTRSAHPKVWARSGVLIGIAGQLDQLQRIAYRCKIPRYRRRQDPSSYMGRHLVPALKLAFAADMRAGEQVDLEMLVGVGGQLFGLDHVFSFSLVGPEWAIGSGGEAARAALCLLSARRGPEARALAALAVAARVCPSVSAPYDVIVS